MPADHFEISIDTSDLVRRLDGLSQKLAKGVLNDALAESGHIMQAAIKQAVIDRSPRGASGEPRPYKDPNGNSIMPELLAEDIDIDPYVKSNGQSANVEVGPTDLTAHVARWINNGFVHVHGGRRHRKGVEDAQIPGTHFMESGFDESSAAALETFTATLAKGIEDAYSDK